MPAGPRRANRNAGLVSFGVVKPRPDELEHWLNAANPIDRPNELRQATPGILQHVRSSDRSRIDGCPEARQDGRNSALDRKDSQPSPVST